MTGTDDLHSQNDDIADPDTDDEVSMPLESERASWLDDASQEIDDIPVEEFDIVSSPNDWNFATIVNFIDSGALKIPSFQRNYVWDRKRASKLIESLLLGLPVPQVFLYEQDRNQFIVIDGQQRLLSLFFFAKGRFPRANVRGALRPKFGEGNIDDDLLHDDQYFESFRLSLPKTPTGRKNRYHGLTYHGLKDDKISLDLRTIRNTVVKQTSPEGNAAVFEIFSRLNAGGMNLSPQEIRASLYHSGLIARLLDVNLDKRWRGVVGVSSPDPRMRDTEFLLRSLALARGLDNFGGSMAGFVNSFCMTAQSFTTEQTEQAVGDLLHFIAQFEGTNRVFERGGKFSGVLFESFFTAWVRSNRPAVEQSSLVAAVRDVKNDDKFAMTLQEGSTKPVNIRGRVNLAELAMGRDQ
ncbi:DUF262 domain-containing protein [Mycolicibacterium porcinum]